jgi:hypothetical protein
MGAKWPTELPIRYTNWLCRETGHLGNEPLGRRSVHFGDECVDKRVEKGIKLESAT